MLKKQTVKALKWSALAEIASRTVGPLSYLILARLLAPQDFGLVAISTSLAALALVFVDGGLGKTLIQRRARVLRSASIVFWCNLLLAGGASTMLWVAAPFAADLFGSAELEGVLRFLILYVFLTAMGAAPAALLQRALRYRDLFWARTASILLPMPVTIAFALSGAGYWSLVIGMVAGQAILASLLWRLSGWRPRTLFDGGLARELWSFSSWALASAFLAWCFMWLEILLIGWYLDTYATGLYRVSNQFVAATLGACLGPFLPVVYGALSRARGDLVRIRTGTVFATHAAALLVIPAGAGLWLTSDLIASVVLGARWQAAAMVMALLAVTQAIAYTVSVNQEAYRSIGRPDLETKVMLVSLAIRLSLYSVAIDHGLEALLIAKLVATCIGVVNHLGFAWLYLRITPLDYLSGVARPLVSTILMVLAGWWLVRPALSGMPEPAQLISLVVSCVVLYSVAAMLVDRRYLRVALGAIRGRS